MTREEFKPVIQTLMNAYGDRFKVNQSMFNTWYEMLCDLNCSALIKAVKDIVQRSAYVPTIAEIRAVYAENEERTKADIREIKERYDVMSGMFADGDTDEARNAYAELIRMAKDKVKAARWIFKVANERAETGTFTEFMVGLLNEQRSRS